MTLLGLEGFEDGLHAYRSSGSGGYSSAAVSATYGKDGSGGRVGDDHTASYSIGLDSVTSGTYVGGANVYVLATGGGSVCGFTKNNNVPSYYSVRVMVDPTNHRWYVTDRTGTVYAADNTFYVNTWYYVELKVVLDNSVGSWELRVDGVTILSATGRDTLSDDVTSWQFGGGSSGDIDSMYVDNIYLLDNTGSVNNDFLGPCRVDSLLPNGNGASSDWTGSDANQIDNYLLVDTSDTADYVESTTEGDTDTYALTDLTGTEDVLGVDMTMLGQKTDTGAKYVRTVVRSGTTDYPGDTVALSDSTWGGVYRALDVDPDTASAWTLSGVDALEVGAEVRDSL